MTAPLTVTSAEPGAAAVPICLNHSGPYLAMRATCASVSTFRTSVGRRWAPRVAGRGGTNVGRAAPPFSALISAVSWPAR